MDVLTPAQRSRCMASVRDRDTTPELRLRRALWKAGLRYRLRYKLPGKPDLVLVRARIAVFVDGCFWHGCPVHATMPKTNAEFWIEKLRMNVQRDLDVNDELARLGWKVVRFWSHELRDLTATTQRLTREIHSRDEGCRQRDATTRRPTSKRC